jgi:catechol 2,3-dioxygenase-like lactoylglutathione lyase family enzyme
MTSSVFLEAAPFLLVDDVVKAAEYYRDVLGFELSRYFGEPPGFVIVRRNAARIMLRQSQIRPALLSNTSKVSEALDLYVWVSDVETLAEELRRRGARIVSEPELEDGRREMLVKDLDGYLLCFGEVEGWPL